MANAEYRAAEQGHEQALQRRKIKSRKVGEGRVSGIQYLFQKEKKFKSSMSN